MPGITALEYRRREYRPAALSPREIPNARVPISRYSYAIERAERTNGQRDKRDAKIFRRALCEFYVS